MKAMRNHEQRLVMLAASASGRTFSRNLAVGGGVLGRMIIDWQRRLRAALRMFEQTPVVILPSWPLCSYMAAGGR